MLCGLNGLFRVFFGGFLYISLIFLLLLRIIMCFFFNVGNNYVIIDVDIDVFRIGKNFVVIYIVFYFVF